MKRSDLDKKLKEKILLEGLSGSGKTNTSLRISKLYLLNGMKVVYIDPEHGTDRDISTMFRDLTDEQLDNFELVHATDIKSYIRAMHGVIEDVQVGSVQTIQNKQYLDFDLKVCDGITTELELYKTELTTKFIKQGYYEIGGRQFPIKNPDTFVLPYQFYSKLYDQIREALVIMIQHKYDLIATMHPLKDTETQQSLAQDIYQKFDSVIKLDKIITPDGYPKWSGRVVKNRGRESPDKRSYLPTIDLLLKFYVDKFNMNIDDVKDSLLIRELDGK